MGCRPDLEIVHALRGRVRLRVAGDQQQVVESWDLVTASHLMIAGQSRSGRSNCLRVLAGGIARQCSPEDVHLYGIDAGGVFCGESMFYKTPNASKLALLFLIDHLKSRGSTWLDAQVMTPHMKAFGTQEIDRRKFLDKLGETQKAGLKLFG